MVWVQLMEFEPVCVFEIENGGVDITVDLVRVLSLNLLVPAPDTGFTSATVGKKNIYIFALSST